MSVEQAFAEYRRLLAELKYFGPGQRLSGTLFHKMHAFLKREPVGWYDFHAKPGFIGQS